MGILCLRAAVELNEENLYLPIALNGAACNLCVVYGRVGGLWVMRFEQKVP